MLRPVILLTLCLARFALSGFTSGNGCESRAVFEEGTPRFKCREGKLIDLFRKHDGVCDCGGKQCECGLEGCSGVSDNCDCSDEECCPGHHFCGQAKCISEDLVRNNPAKCPWFCLSLEDHAGRCTDYTIQTATGAINSIAAAEGVYKRKKWADTLLTFQPVCKKSGHCPQAALDAFAEAERISKQADDEIQQDATGFVSGNADNNEAHFVKPLNLNSVPKAGGGN